MTGFLIFVGISAIIFAIIPLLFSLRFSSYVNRYSSIEKKTYVPKTSLIIPCKGIDPGFEKNITALFKQDYPNYELIFVTATDDDPACSIISNVITNYPHSDARLYTAGIVQGRSQKINNQICGLGHVAKNSEILVFIDSDAKPNADFLSNLIAPLSEKKLGMTEEDFQAIIPETTETFARLMAYHDIL